MSSADDCETDLTAFFGFDSGSGAAWSSFQGLALGSAEFLSVGNDQVHVLIKGEHLPDHLSAVIEGNSHPVVD
jgi:hypothetical protein